MTVFSKVTSQSLALLAIAIVMAASPAYAGRILNGHVPAAARAQLPLSDVPETDHLRLAIGLSVRDPAALQAFIKEVSDPQSPNFRQYLTPQQFTERFGPREDEYQAVIRFAEAKGLTVTETHANRLVVDVNGSVADIQRAFHVRLHNFQHPTEARTFFAPDTDPELDVPVPIAHISGLTNYWLPRPQSRRRPLGEFRANAAPRVGSGPSGNFRGNDFRAAYLPGVTLTGAGQAVALVQFDGYNASDITTYEQACGLPNVPLQNVLVDGYSGRAGGGNGEVCLDIQMAISMAPGLSKVLVYEAPNSSPWEDVLSRIANDNLAKQVSCSWGGGPPSSVAEQIFMQMATQGQTFFNASGDDNAEIGSVAFPSDSPNVIQVGGTDLFTVAPGGAWSGETVWNWDITTGSGGGFSSVYPIPSWQQNISMVANQGSTAFRNFPDVSLTADNIYTVSDNGQVSTSAGTSASAPLWAGLAALINEQAANMSKPPVGYFNPALYQLAKGNLYSVLFHDVTSGNNINRESGGRFLAVAGFDLCTGWGTPTASLIPALVSPNSLVTHTVTVTGNPANGGTLFGGAAYLEGTSATVTAVATVGFAFAGWTENGTLVSTAPSYTFSVDADRSLVANFNSAPITLYTVVVSAVPANGGTVSGGGRFTAGSGDATFALPKRKFSFVNWTENGVVVSTDANYSFTVDRDRNLVATFGKKARKRRR